MELHQLRYAVAVSRRGNFSRAAEDCHVAQPSLSQQIRKLEEELGGPVFERRRRAVTLTSLGDAFLPRAVRILEEVAAAAREATESQKELRGPFALGVLPTLAPYLLPSVLPGFSGRHPQVEWMIQEDLTSPLIKQVMAGELDLALVSRPVREERLAARSLFHEELLLALPSGHPLLRRRRLAAADLAGLRFILLKAGHCLGDQVLHFCERRGLEPVLSLRSGQLETILSLVAAGMGVSLVPALAAARRGSARVEYRSLVDPKPRREILAIWPKSRPPGRVATEFLRVVGEHFTGDVSA